MESPYIEYEQEIAQLKAHINRMTRILGTVVMVARDGRLSSSHRPDGSTEVVIDKDALSRVNLSKVDLCVRSADGGGMKFWFEKAIDPKLAKSAKEKLQNGAGLGDLTQEECAAIGMSTLEDAEGKSVEINADDKIATVITKDK